ncbi:unnamed protein product [Fraxinus pennsylvanica]|uniref:Pentatricopeptide repeat-containing protein n=1 Tax=Fraxinus pennsylvanica TaxID=56036 RepID=A0AAD2E6E9_9LAMI|nr:unnamed protein product [Fraxinus pennsylvanica]
MPQIHSINELQVAKLSKALEQIKNSSNYRIINEIHAHSVTLGVFNTHQDIACRLLNTYVQLKKPNDAQKLFGQIPNPDIVSWTSLQNLYLNIGQPMKALMLFSKLIVLDFVKPDSHSIVAALSACARCKDLVNGKSIHGMVHKYLERPRPVVHNALIDMYSFLFRLSVSSSRSLSSITDQAQYSSGKDLHYDFQVALGNREEEEIFREGRMDIETRDYSKTGANNHHDPRPPGSF